MAVRTSWWVLDGGYGNVNVNMLVILLTFLYHLHTCMNSRDGVDQNLVYTIAILVAIRKWKWYIKEVRVTTSVASFPLASGQLERYRRSGITLSSEQPLFRWHMAHIWAFPLAYMPINGKIEKYKQSSTHLTLPKNLTSPSEPPLHSCSHRIEMPRLYLQPPGGQSQKLNGHHRNCWYVGFTFHFLPEYHWQLSD